MTARPVLLVLSLALGAAGLGALAAAPAATAAGCGTVLSATRNGADATSLVTTNCFSLDGANYVSWGVAAPGGGNDLGTAARGDAYVITIDTGTTIPRVTDTRGSDVTVSRLQTGDGHWHVRVSAKPVLLTEGCSNAATPWSCPAVATKEWDGYLGGQVTDYGTWADPAQRAAFFGMDYSSNIDLGTIPPQIVPDPDSDAEMLFIELAAPHLRTDGSTVFIGDARIVIPNAFLKEVYEIDDPSSLTTLGLDPDLSGKGAGKSTVADIGGALQVDIAGLTFSQRDLTIARGTIAPARPKKLTTKRTSASTAKLGYAKAKSRGSKVTGYAITCSARTGRHTVRAKDTKPATTVKRLRAGVAYDCKVRATSKAGKGSAATVKVKK